MPSASPAAPLLVVLGLPEVGGASLERALHLCGAPGLEAPELPQQLVALFEAAGNGWQSPQALSERWFQSEAAQRFVAEASTSLAPVAPGLGGLRVLQLAGLERVLPLWQAAIAELPLQPAYVLLLRHPLELAEQLRLQHGWSRDQALLVWLQSALAMEAHSRGQQRLVIEREQLLWDLDGALDRLERGLGLQLPERNHERLLAWERERPESLSTPPLVAAPQGSPLLQLALELHGWLQAEARGQERRRLLPQVIHQQLQWAEALYGRSLAEERQQRQRVEAKLEQLQSSRLVRLRQWFAGRRAA